MRTQTEILSSLLLCAPSFSSGGFFQSLQYTVNHEFFVAKIFSDNLACAKIKPTKYMRNINNNVVQDRLSKNYLT